MCHTYGIAPMFFFLLGVVVYGQEADDGIEAPEASSEVPEASFASDEEMYSKVIILLSGAFLVIIICMVVYWYIRWEPRLPSAASLAMVVGIAIGGIARGAGIYNDGFRFNDAVFTFAVCSFMVINCLLLYFHFRQ